MSLCQVIKIRLQLRTDTIVGIIFVTVKLHKDAILRETEKMITYNPGVYENVLRGTFRNRMHSY